MVTPRSEKNINERDHGAPSPPSRHEAWRSDAPRLYRRQNHVRQNLSPPSHADQEAEAQRQADGCQRTLGDNVFQRLLDRGSRIGGGVHHRTATLRHFVDRLLRVGARLLVSAAGLLGGGAGKTVEGVSDLIGQGCDIVFLGGYIL